VSTVIHEFMSAGGRHAASLRRAVTLASLGIALVGAVSGAQAQTVGSAVEVARATTLRAGDVMRGRLAASRPVDIAVSLKLRNREALDAFIATNSAGPGLGAAQPMSAAQLEAEHLPTIEQAQAVVKFLRSAGFRNIEVAPNRMLVTAQGTAATAEAAFQTTMMQVTTRDGRDSFANMAAVRVPAELQDSVMSVIGMQDVFRPHTFSKVLQPNDLTTSSTTSGRFGLEVGASGLQPNDLAPLAVTGHNPNEFSSIYGANGVPTAAGVTVGIITQGRLTQTITDLNTFTANNGLATVTTQTVNTNGTSADTSGVIEWNLDSQDIVGAAGGQVGRIIFYNIPTLSNTNLTADINTVVSANAAKIINVSLGECELAARQDGSAAAQDQSFATAVAQGQTFSISTGDSGADECGDGGVKPSWPAASQFVVAVSGTRLDASTTTYNSEVVWNDLAGGGGATGGSLSTFEPKPAFQNGFVNGTLRGVADIAFTGAPASGARIVFNGGTSQVGGTSLSAPIFAGLWARVLAVKGTNVGFAAPLLYALPASDFHDVTTGNNGGSTAGAGYDLATGRGSLILGSAINHIGGAVTPPPANKFFQNTTPQTINDLSTINSTIAVSGLTGPGPTNLQVAVNITHTFRGDLKVDLIAPNGATATLSNRVGGSADNIIMTFSINASSLANTNGTWTLRIADQARGDVGRLNSWSLQF
jgi:subtilase family serine protease